MAYELGFLICYEGELLMWEFEFGVFTRDYSYEKLELEVIEEH